MRLPVRLLPTWSWKLLSLVPTRWNCPRPERIVEYRNHSRRCEAYRVGGPEYWLFIVKISSFLPISPWTGKCLLSLRRLICWRRGNGQCRSYHESIQKALPEIMWLPWRPKLWKWIQTPNSIAVKPLMIWGWVGVLIIIVAIGAVCYLFRKWKEVSMDERVIALTDLTKQYGRFTAVDRMTAWLSVKGRFSDY